MVESKLTVLGNGGAFSDNTTSYLINENILIDCSYATIKRLIKSKQIDKINILIITHSHDDHIGGLSAFIEYKRYVQNNTDFTIYAGSYFKDHYFNLAVSKGSHGDVFDFTYYQISYSMKLAFYSDGESFDIRFIPIKHCNWTIETFGIKLQGCLSSIFISSDVDSDYLGILKYVVDESDLSILDMGWTGLPEIDNQVHPSETDIHKVFKDNNNILGIHCGDISLYRKVDIGEVFKF